jgi:hypothetical protein
MLGFELKEIAINTHTGIEKASDPVKIYLP